MPPARRCPDATLALCRRADAILLGAVGGPKWSDPNAKVRPEQGLLQLRKALGLFANLRPVVPHPAVLDASPIKPELLRGRRHHGGARTDRGNLFRRQAAQRHRGDGRVPLQRGGNRARRAARRASSRAGAGAS